MSGAAPAWIVASFAVHLLAALACAGAALWLLQRGERARPDRRATLAALVLTAAWTLLVSAYGPQSAPASIGETLRDLAWLHVLYRLFEVDGRHRSLRAIRPLIGTLAFVEALQPVLLTVRASFAAQPVVAGFAQEHHAIFAMLFAVGALVLVHNLYVGASPAARQVLRWSSLGLAAVWLYELNLHTVSYLGGSVVELHSLYGLVITAAVACLVLGLNPDRARGGIRPSRTAAFQSLSLLVIGAYLAFMVGIARWLQALGGDFAPLAQVGFVFFGSLAALYWVPSRRLREWVRVVVLKNLFRHRYDYRAEWLRFNQTIGRDCSVPLAERAVQALADMTESPGGLLFLPDEGGQFECAANWRWSGLSAPCQPLRLELTTLMARHGYIVELDDVRAGQDRHGEAALVDEWLAREPQCWALVPLLHFDRLVGVLLLARPAASRRLDWEDLDLLKVAGQQLASYLAEQNTQQALMEAARFEEFNRRMAFVMHDIKNLASQLGLLARNAEKHADNPAFRADMLVTLRNSSDKLTQLLARLGRYGAAGAEARLPLDPGEIVTRVAARFAPSHPVSAIIHQPCLALAAPEALEQALSHLVQNAVEASAPNAAVLVELARAGSEAVIQVVDSGSGMTPQFIRNGLFKPFVSSKNGGFGIGAFEARELVRAMGGTLDVESHEGLGTRFIIRLPLAEPSAQLESA